MPNSDDLESGGVLWMLSTTQETPVTICSTHQEHWTRRFENMIADVGLVVHVSWKIHYLLDPLRGA